MNLEYLRHGKALCGKVFRRFVETFNFHNDFVTNLKGDADLPVVGGRVKLDRTDERHPVIRCSGCAGGGGGGGGGAAVQDRGCFYIKSRTAKEATEATDDADAQPERVEIEFGNQYFMHGGILKHCNFDKYVLTEQGIVSLHLSANGTMAPELVQHASFSLLAADQVGTLEEYWHPLYEFDADGNVLADFRVIPTIVMGEFL